MPGGRGMRRSGSLDLKLMVGIYSGHDLISGVHARSDDQEPTGRGTAGATKSGDSDRDSAWDRVGQLERGTGDLPGCNTLI